MNLLPDSWTSWAAFCGTAAAMYGVFYLVIRQRMGADFVPRSELVLMHEQNVSGIGKLADDHKMLRDRVLVIEERLNQMATREDVRRLDAKIGELTATTGKIEGAVEGVEKGIDRVFAQLQLLTRASLPEGRGDR